MTTESMDVNKAIGITELALKEGFGAQEPMEIIEAWQHLLDAKIVQRLKTPYGRIAKAMVEAGLIDAGDASDAMSQSRSWK